jgi:1,2-diacylglycerol 3-alpha-glucosyltransferase
VKILLTTETYLPYMTGVSVSTDSIARYMVSQGHTVILVCPKPLAKGELVPLDGLTIINVPSLPFALYNLNAQAFFPQAMQIIGKLFKENKFDIVHVQESGSIGIAALINARKYHVRIIGSLHFIPEQIDRVLWGGFENILTPIIDLYIKFIWNKYDEIMTPSFYFASYLKKIGVKRPINVVSNGTDTENFHPGSRNENLRSKLGFSEKDFVFFFLGRVDRDKNVETLIRAMPFTDPEIKLLVVGKGSEKGFLKRFAKKMKVDERIIWVDYITNEEMTDYYHAVDAFSIMSGFEGQSIVALQAVATGLPIIAAHASALPELCHDGENGFLVDTYDFRTLSEKMDELAHHKELRKKFEIESRKISLEHHKPKVLHKLELIYERL